MAALADGVFFSLHPLEDAYASNVGNRLPYHRLFKLSYPWCYFCTKQRDSGITESDVVTNNSVHVP